MMGSPGVWSIELMLVGGDVAKVESESPDDVVWLIVENPGGGKLDNGGKC